MAFRCTIDGDILRIDAVGEYGLSEVRAAMQAALEDPAFVAPMWFVADARESRANPPVSEMLETVDYGRSITEQFHSQWVVVVSGSLRFGLARMLSLLLAPYGIQLRVCQSEIEARALVDELRQAV